jgi:hypothetical protein
LDPPENFCKEIFQLAQGERLKGSYKVTIDNEYQIEWSREHATKLVNLADLMQEHPGFNWSGWNLGTIYVDNALEMATVIQALGGRWEKKTNDYEFSMVQKGGERHFDLKVSGEHSAVCVKVGEEAVETETEIDEATIAAVRAGETKIVKTKVKPIWECPPSILKEAGEILFVEQ